MEDREKFEKLKNIIDKLSDIIDEIMSDEDWCYIQEETLKLEDNLKLLKDVSCIIKNNKQAVSLEDFHFFNKVMVFCDVILEAVLNSEITDSTIRMLTYIEQSTENFKFVAEDLIKFIKEDFKSNLKDNEEMYPKPKIEEKHELLWDLIPFFNEGCLSSEEIERFKRGERYYIGFKLEDLKEDVLKTIKSVRKDNNSLKERIYLRKQIDSFILKGKECYYEYMNKTSKELYDYIMTLEVDENLDIKSFLLGFDAFYRILHTTTSSEDKRGVMYKIR